MSKLLMKFPVLKFMKKMNIFIQKNKIPFQRNIKIYISFQIEKNSLEKP